MSRQCWSGGLKSRFPGAKNVQFAAYVVGNICPESPDISVGCAAEKEARGRRSGPARLVNTDKPQMLVIRETGPDMEIHQLNIVIHALLITLAQLAAAGAFVTKWRPVVYFIVKGIDQC
jgi:hypothetical protein